MKLKHPSMSKLHPVPLSATDGLLRLSPESIGRIGGEMVQRMVGAAQQYLQELTVSEVKKVFYKEILKDLPESIILRAKTLSRETDGLTPSPPPTGGEVHANQYHAGIGPH